jgi:hypothetical protein
MVLPVRTPLQDVTWARALGAMTIPKLADNTTAKNFSPVIISSRLSAAQSEPFRLKIFGASK